MFLLHIVNRHKCWSFPAAQLCIEIWFNSFPSAAGAPTGLTQATLRIVDSLPCAIWDYTYKQQPLWKRLHMPISEPTPTSWSDWTDAKVGELFGIFISRERVLKWSTVLMWSEPKLAICPSPIHFPFYYRHCDWCLRTLSTCFFHIWGSTLWSSTSLGSQTKQELSIFNCLSDPSFRLPIHQNT